MSKLGLFGGGQPQTPGAAPAPPSQPIIGQNMFRRGPGGIFPERGSQAQYDMVQSLLASALSQAPNSGSPLVAFLAPLITGAVGSRTQGLYDQRIADEEQAKKDKAAAANQSAMDVLMGALGAPMSGGGTGGGGQALPGGPNASRNAALQAFGGPTKAAAEALAQGIGGGSVKLDTSSLGPKRPHMPLENVQTGLQSLAESVFGPGSTVRLISGMGDHGSPRHRKGHAADVQFIDPSGKVVTLDDPRAQSVPQAAAAAGFLGLGAGKEYMGDSTFHLDKYPRELYTPKMGPAWGSWGNQYESQFVNGGGPQAALALANSLPTQPGPQRRTYTPEMQRGLMGIIGNENVPAGYRNLAVKMLTDSMTPPAAGPGLDDRIDTAQNLIDLQNSMSPKPRERKYATAPDGIPRYVDNGEPVYPGILPRDNQNDAGVMRQKNEATEAVQKEIGRLTGAMGGRMSLEEARAQIARDPLYAAQLRMLGINPEDWVKAAEVARNKREAEQAAEKAADGGGAFNLGGLFGSRNATESTEENDPLGIR